MSKKSIGFKVHLGFDDIESIADVLHLCSVKIKKSLKFKDVTTECKFTGIEIVDNKDFTYSIMFNFDNELSINEILDRVITGETNG